MYRFSTRCWNLRVQVSHRWGMADLCQHNWLQNYNPKRTIQIHPNRRRILNIMKIKCPYCVVILTRGNTSRDHILPKHKLTCEQKEQLNQLRIRNVRACCISCNQMKEMAGDCVGALICARAVAHDIFKRHPTPKHFTRLVRRILTQWRLMNGAQNGKHD